MPVARLNGVNINYQVEGQGEPLVMIMGFSATRSGWIRQIPFFKKYYRVITFDNRGAGKSDKPAGPYSTRMMADDTLGLMDLLGIEKATLQIHLRPSGHGPDEIRGNFSYGRDCRTEPKLAGNTKTKARIHRKL